MNEYEARLLIDELLKSILNLKKENDEKDFQIVCLKEDVKSLRSEVARLEAAAAEKAKAGTEAKAS